MNILFLIADDITPNALGCYGRGLPTRAIDQLAASGVRFTNAWCASAVCTPSRYSYLTGAFGSRCTHPQFLATAPASGPASVEFNVWLDGKTPTLGSVLRSAGYRTGFAGKWHNSPHADALGCETLDRRASPHDPGMDAALARRQEILCSEVRRAGGYDFAGGVLWENPTEEPLDALVAHHLEWSLAHALDFLDTCSPEQPFFLHYASTCYHGPNLVDTVERHSVLETPGGRLDAPPRGAIPRHEWRARCAEHGLPFNHESLSFLWLDRELAILRDALAAKGLLENTLIVFAGDHGNEPAKGTCYDPGCRVPLILAGPGLPHGTTCPLFAQNVDLLPTLLDLAGIPLPPEAAPDGRSLRPAWETSTPVRDAVYLENGFTRAIRTGRWKYLVRQLPPGRQLFQHDGQTYAADHYGADWTFPALRIAASMYPGYFDAEQLYDLTADPREQTNLASDPAHAAVLGEMRALLRRHLATLPGQAEIPPPASDLPPDTLARTLARFSAASVPWWPEAEERYRRHVHPNEPPCSLPA